MKKILLAMAVAFTFVACNNEKKPAEEGTPVDSPKVETPAPAPAPVTNDTAAKVDTAVKPAQ